MSLRYAKKLMLAKTETVYGTDAVPDAANNTIRTNNLNVDPFNNTGIERNLDRAILGAQPRIHAGIHGGMQFNIEVAGSGTSGVSISAAKWSPILQAMGFAEDVITTVSQERVEYKPVSGSFSSLTMHGHFDGQKHAFVGARGSGILQLSPLAIPYLQATFLGLFVDPAAATDPTGDFTGWVDPNPVDNTNTPTVDIDGYGATMLDFSCNFGNVFAYRNVVGDESVEITDRNMVGSIRVDAPPLATKDFFAKAKANGTGAIQLIHGVTAGNIIQIDAPNAQFSNPRYVDSNGVRALEMDLIFVPSTGNDEITITQK